MSSVISSNKQSFSPHVTTSLPSNTKTKEVAPARQDILETAGASSGLKNAGQVVLRKAAIGTFAVGNTVYAPCKLSVDTLHDSFIDLIECGPVTAATTVLTGLLASAYMGLRYGGSVGADAARKMFPAPTK